MIYKRSSAGGFFLAFIDEEDDEEEAADESEGKEEDRPESRSTIRDFLQDDDVRQFLDEEAEER
jgi:hypothetical protein